MEYIMENCTGWKQAFSNLLCVLLVKLAFHWESLSEVRIPGFMNIEHRQWVRAERRWRRNDLSFMWGDAPESPPDEEDVSTFGGSSGKSPTWRSRFECPGRFGHPMVYRMGSTDLNESDSIEDLRKRISRYSEDHPDEFEARAGGTQQAPVHLTVTSPMNTGYLTPTANPFENIPSEGKTMNQIRKWGCHFDAKTRQHF
ncbi:hypothetical protein EAG_13537 [Camponotus floridanus]|uniref:Uncharacterized protein n=1 Tax=Camponotus floridanus TaxID=104421 RepID=E1ZZK0_CAMFO|nr:hypothetical protein EAG_13537 [Camponotus floridanus]